MIQCLLLLSLLLVGCSSQKLTRNDLLKLSVSHKEIPTKNKETARDYMNQQHRYLTLLYEQFPDSPMPIDCRANKVIGEVKESKGQLLMVSLVSVDRNAKINGCDGLYNNIHVWDVYFYCDGDLELTNMKIRKDHMPEFKDVSLCE